MVEYLRIGCGNLIVVASDNDDVKKDDDDDDDDDANSKDAEVVKIGIAEIIRIFDRLINDKEIKKCYKLKQQTFNV